MSLELCRGGVKQQGEQQTATRARPKPRKRHGPCDNLQQEQEE